MLNLPDKLSRKAIAKTFDDLTPTAWEKLFVRESQNGLSAFRESGDFPTRAYYRTNDLIHWLIRNGYYTPQQLFPEDMPPPRLTVRTHIMA